MVGAPAGPDRGPRCPRGGLSGGGRSLRGLRSGWGGRLLAGLVHAVRVRVLGREPWLTGSEMARSACGVVWNAQAGDEHLRTVGAGGEEKARLPPFPGPL